MPFAIDEIFFTSIEYVNLSSLLTLVNVKALLILPSTNKLSATLCWKFALNSGSALPIPMPLTVNVLLPAAPVIAIVPVRSPLYFGVNVTVIVAEPTQSVVLESVALNSSELVLLILTVSSFVKANVLIFAALVVSHICSPKSIVSVEPDNVLAITTTIFEIVKYLPLDVKSVSLVLTIWNLDAFPVLELGFTCLDTVVVLLFSTFHVMTFP